MHEYPVTNYMYLPYEIITTTPAIFDGPLKDIFSRYGNKVVNTKFYSCLPIEAIEWYNIKRFIKVIK